MPIGCLSMATTITKGVTTMRGPKDRKNDAILDMYFEDHYKGKLSTMNYKIERQYMRQYYNNLLEENDVEEN